MLNGSSWAPFVSDPVISILDVAPLGLVRTYMADVSSVGEVNGVASTVQRKKSLAAEILERSKKQSIAFVPKDIAKLAEKFFPLFNVALFPHKPPPAPVANRVLFTDSEDGLLAMGLMEYNNDWELIQQRFLPCKTKHQIFVRQKNRSSSKAPENPIKVVRRIKTAPLTSEEKALIYEGLKVLKLDWTSIWRLLVPYRDPSLLQRQWRVATGTQKTYKITSDAAKAKRRQYELNRRSRKKALAATQTLSEKEVDSEADNGSDSDTEEEDEAYVHEAFLAEWEPESSKLISTEFPSCRLDKSTTDSSGVWPYEKSQTTQQVYSDPVRQEDRPIHGSFPSSKSLAHAGYAASSTSNWSMKSPSSHINSQLHRKRKRGISQVVKLAPDLPPVNLPPSVRVISQSAFQSNPTGAFCSGVVQSGRNDQHLRLPHAAKGDTSVNSGSCKNGSEEQGVSLHQPAVESELQLHPLLFRDPENATGSGTMNFFSRTLSQSNLDLFRTPQLSSRQVDHASSAQSLREMPQNSSTIDFHPLLRRSDNVDGLNSVDRPFSDAVLFQNKLGKFSDSPARNSTVPRSTDGQSLATTSVSGCLHEKPNELDLDIYLSCAPNKKQRVQSSERNELQSNEFIAGALIHQSAGRSQQANTQLRHCQENLTEAASVTNSHVLRVKNVIRSDIESSTSDETRLLDVNDTRMQGHPVRGCFTIPDDQSLPHIVMEQEELSDSDEDNGEHVEFECEEMADSEEDELNYEQPAGMRNKVGSPVMAEEDESPAKDSTTGHHLRPENQNIRFSVIKGTACSSKSGSTEKDKAIAGLIQSRSDPSVVADSTLNPKLESGSLVPTGLHGAPHPLNRSSRKRSSKSSKVQSPDTQKTYISTAATRKAKRSSHRNSPEATINDRSRDRNICSTDSSDNRHWVDLNLVEKDCLAPSPSEATDSASKL
ncbi:hypothetical protein QJS10_CPA10g01129 [Acorus calamus]|uniref:Homeodomain-like superfamily protein n=1 Tax=Acorus calamus TaxID=4465 RepID=A0AAV9E0L3_ACOCL|nr:hypothetical protein QJS10_CPA10g01129 [Acorus calamus]